MGPLHEPLSADRWIAAALRGESDPAPDVPATTLVARARLHGVGALLHAATARAPERVPPGVRDALRELAVRAAALELGRRQELERLLERAADAGIRPVLLKGTALAYGLYPEPALRERADTDLLVGAGERERLFDVLAAQGYQRRAGVDAELASSEASFSKGGSPLVLDVHWRINNSPLLAGVLDFEELAAQAAPLAALGPHARAPCPAHAVLLAAIHRAGHHQSPFYAGGVAHRGDRLIWLYDLHLLAPSLGPDERAALVLLATRHRVAGLCLDALLHAREAFGTALPPGLVEALRRAASRPEPSMVFLRGGRRRLLLEEVRAVQGWGERWRLLREHAFPPAAYMLDKYGTNRRWLLPALYVRRALGWLARA